MDLSDADVKYVETILREHRAVGGTRWDHERKSTYELCGKCEHRGYLAGDKPDHIDHIIELILWRAK